MQTINYYLKFIENLKKHVESFEIITSETTIQFKYNYKGSCFIIMYAYDYIVPCVTDKLGHWYNKIEYQSPYNLNVPNDIDFDNFDYVSFLEDGYYKMIKWIS